MQFLYRSFCLLIVVNLVGLNNISAQKKSKESSIAVYVDSKGVLRYSSDKSEASFFGVNYTSPFAYAYRAHKAVNADLERSIREDVYHFARLGFNAFRVHVWDTEITDTLGNLLENEHLRLFDFLLAELKKRNIYTIITPIAFWGNGYPERDEPTPGFSRFFGRGKLTSNDTAIRAQENYMKQFFSHVNPYTNTKYGDDPAIIAVELNNEPSHSNPKSGVTNYINRLAAALKATGWKKPVFYNISQGPYFSDAVAASVVDGFSFQWYPSGLVGNQTLQGNYLPHIDRYHIPFRDTVPAFSNKALMVYEFDAADLMQPIMYPVMAKSFRQAGFQWATQFAYDPLAIAYGNTEYQTHYLNLAYTPKKAISMLIASKAFQKLPRLKNYGTYPADTSFDAFRVSYDEQLSEMNNGQEFYYANNTNTIPSNQSGLRHIAGVGNSPVVRYSGSGAYFLDKLSEGEWRLELMPDAIPIRDPFERASPEKEVTRIEWKENEIDILLDELGAGFDITGLNEGNNFKASSADGKIKLSPGTYAITRKGKAFSSTSMGIGNIGLREFVAPNAVGSGMYLRHDPLTEVSGNKSFIIKAIVAGIDTGKVTLLINRVGGPFRNIAMKKTGANEYEAEVPAELVQPGLLNYRIVLQKGHDYAVFPGNHKGNPFAWDNYITETWSTMVAAEKTALEIFNPGTERNIKIFPVFRRGFQTTYPATDKAGQLAIRLAIADLSVDKIMGFQYTFLNKLKGRISEAQPFDKLVIRAKSGDDEPITAKVSLISADGQSFYTMITLNNQWTDFSVSLKEFKPGNSLLLPRSYPEFQPLLFKSTTEQPSIQINRLEKLEITVGEGIPATGLKKPFSFEVATVQLQKASN